MTSYATSVRIKRSEFILDMKQKGREAGALAMAEVFLDPPDWARTWAVATALANVPGMGRSRLTKLASSAELFVGSRIGDLAPGKRKAVARYLTDDFATNQNEVKDG